jgi:ACS family hexuronate transporter-like MFS transporter
MNRHRWTILALLFASTVLNYVDRQALSILATTVQADLGMSTAEYARVVQLFLGAYIVGYGVSGWLTDRLGTKLSLALFVGWWSLANFMTGLVQNVAQLGAARAALGVGEAGNYTAAPKAVSEQFPPQERGLAVGIYTAGAMVGATLAPPLIGWLALTHGWRAAFMATGAAGFVWLVAWLLLYRSPASAPGAVKLRLPMRELVRDRSLWLLASGRLVADPVWYFYLFWFPKYLIEGVGLSLAQVATWAWVVYLAADVGSVGGGWASGRLVKRGVAPQTARLRVMAVGALLAPLGAFIGGQPGMAATLALGALVAASHLLFMVNHTALVVDRYPSHGVASAFGFMGMASGLGGMLSTQFVGQLVSAHSYTLMFALLACLHPLAWALTGLAARQSSPRSDDPLRDGSESASASQAIASRDH